MRILIITYQGGLAGSTNSISYLAKGLASRGHSVWVGAPPSSLLRTLLEGTPVILVPMEITGRLDLSNMKVIRELVRENSIEIINAQSSYDRFTSVLARWLYKLPVKMVHTRRQISSSIGGWLQNLVYVAGTDKVVAVGTGVKTTLVKGGIPSKHIEVIFNGTPASKYAAVDREKTARLRSRFGIKPGDLVVGSVSRRKRQHQLVEAVCELPFSVTLILVGMERRESLERRIAGARARHKVYFEGSVEGGEVLNYFPLFDVHVLCSVTEGLSQSLLEAMYMKVPVIATRASGNTDLIRHGENGLLFPDGDIPALAAALRRLLEDRTLARQLAEAGHQTAAVDFSIDRTITKYENLFQSLLYSRPKTTAS